MLAPSLTHINWLLCKLKSCQSFTFHFSTTHPVQHALVFPVCFVSYLVCHATYLEAYYFSIMDYPRVPILRLPNECLWLIVKHAACYDQPYGYVPIIKQLSLVNKLFREMCLPFLFTAVKVLGSKDSLPSQMTTIMRTPYIVSRLR